jgi:signal transduction histidine kinase/ActR/RegA family two-component response regulator
MPDPVMQTGEMSPGDERSLAQEQLASLSRISMALHAELDLDKVVQRLTDEATAACRAEFGAFFYNVVNDKGESYRLYTLAGVPRERFSRFPMPRNTQVFGPTFRGEGIVRMDDVTKDPRFGKNPPYNGLPKGHLPVCSYLSVPVISRTGEVIGGLFFGHSKPAVFTASDEQLLAAVAAQAATAVENARLYEAQKQARAAAEASQRRTAQLHALTEELSQALSAEGAAKIVTEATRAMFGAEATAVLLLDPSGTRIASVYRDGNSPPASDAVVQGLDLGAATPLTEAARTGRLAWAAGDAYIDKRYPALTAARLATGAKTYGAVPIQFEGRTHGALGVRIAEERLLDADARAFMFAVARQCGQAIERARLHEATLAARAEAEQASRAKDEFLAMLGHELRNPLSPILTAVQLMKLRADPASAKEQSVIERQVNHLIHLVDDLLDISRITRGMVQLDKKPTKLAALISRAVEIASPLLEERRHRLELSLPREDIWLEADELRLCQALTNLLTNAAKYTHPGGTIHVTAERGDGDTVAIRVKDTGIGMAADLVPRVFDLFVQGARTSDRRQGGLGIGLALVRNLVAMHGGEVAAASDGPGRGSEFTIRLPAIKINSDAPGKPTRERALRERLKITPRRILVVDDNQDAASLLGEMLEQVGHEVHVANDGPRALEALARFEPDVAILDIGLPVMDGYELAGALRERLGPSLRLMAVTGYGQEQDRARAERAGFDAHFVKPVALGKLVAAIEMPLVGQGAASPSRAS